MAGKGPGSRFTLERRLWQEIIGLLLLALGGVTLLSLLSVTHGTLSDRWADLLRQLFGWGAYAVALGLGAVGIALLLHSLRGLQEVPWDQVIGAELALAAALALLHLLSRGKDPFRLAQEGGGGGYVGWAISHLLTTALGPPTAALLLAVIGLAGLVWALRLSPRRLAQGAMEALFPGPEVAELPPEEPAVAISPREAPPAPAPPRVVSRRRKRKRAGKVEPDVEGLPPLDLLAPDSPQAHREAVLQERRRIIEETLASFGVPVRVVSISQGPTITQFGVEPGYLERRGPDGRIRRRKVRVSKIQALAKDLALALAASPVRIEAPVPGRSIVGIEVPNAEVSLVALRGVMESEAFQALDSRLKLALGRDVSGQPVVADLAIMPHLLIAGATGSGKSVCSNSI
ncbi:MAG TPA: hypothetical protein EYP55_00970, partial [Anaerolineae bacterium]|nr:hypothetical protein [Anaerolineae bacterium]